VKTRRRRAPWRRIPAGLRYLRTRGLVAAWHRIFPRIRTYESWIEAYDRLKPADIKAIKNHVQALAKRPSFSVILAVNDDREPMLLRAIKSVTHQLYPDWELCVAASSQALDAVAAELGQDDRIKLSRTDGEQGLTPATNIALSTATGEFVVFLSPRDKLAAHALYMIATEVSRRDDIDIFYSDEDGIDDRGCRSCPRFKSDWNPDLFRSCNLIGRLAAYRRSLVRASGGFRSGFSGAEEYDFALRLSEQIEPDRIHHIPMILYHRCLADSTSEASSAEGVRRALTEHLGRSKVGAVPILLSHGHARIRYELPAHSPGVSLIVPTRDRLELLSRCVDGLLGKTDYDHVEVIIVDNDSRLAETQVYFNQIGELDTVRVLQFSGEFNYSAINNFAVSQAKYEIIGFINSDIEVIHSEWLREMTSHAVRPEIGGVGAKLFYPDNTIQHAGTIIGLGGLAGHAFRHFDREEPGYLNRLQLTQNLSAVTAACMLVRRQVFEEVGGFDAANLPVAYSDVDFCLRVRERGYRNIWTPFAQLYHIESGSRASDFAPERIEYYQREANYLKSRWRSVILHDPFYNPNLTLDTEDFGLAYPPRVVRPWRP
jgi:O-antigen biosynthesis protein